MSQLTDVETELRKMQTALAAAGVDSGSRVCELAADIVARCGKAETVLRVLRTVPERYRQEAERMSRERDKRKGTPTADRAHGAWMAYDSCATMLERALAIGDKQAKK